MSNITAAMVKDLRDRTGAGMMDCKQALTEANGDMDLAIELLRKKGLSKAAKKSDRVAAQGLIGVTSTVRAGAVVEVNSETDFVARNAQFQEMVQAITGLAMAAKGDLKALLAATYPGTSNSVEVHVKEAVATIGENIGVRRTAALSVNEGVVADYVHSKAGDGVGKIGVLVALESAGDVGALEQFGRQVAMHIAAASPLAVTPDQLDPAVIEKERAFLTEQALESGKPKEIVEKMIEGRLKKEFFQQVALMSQVYVLDGKASVADAVKDAEKTVGAPIKIKAFVRYALGEGIEKKTEDFAAEVAKTVGAAAPKKDEPKPEVKVAAASAQPETKKAEAAAKPTTAAKPAGGAGKKPPAKKK